MTGARAVTHGAICDRCLNTYLITTWPHAALCPACYLGGMPAGERGRLLANVGATGTLT